MDVLCTCVYMWEHTDYVILQAKEVLRNKHDYKIPYTQYFISYSIKTFKFPLHFY